MGTPGRAGPRRRWRIAVAGIAVVAALAGAAITAERVLGAADVVTEATRDYPATPLVASRGVIGTLAAAPLIVDGRLRVYATKRQVRADAPVDARTQRSPYWSFRRWPAQLLGVAAVGTTVVSRWTDGQLVAIDARTGLVAWRVAGPPPEATAYHARRTGAAAVYAPDGLHTAGRVVIVRGAAEAVAVDAGSGRELWRRGVVGRECRSGEFTTAGGDYVLVTGCGPDREVAGYDAATGVPVSPLPVGPGAVEPLGCRVARSDCAAVRIPATRSGENGSAWLLDGARPAPAPALARPDAALAGDLAITPEGGDSLVARHVSTGRVVWRWLGRAAVLAAQPGRVHLLTEDYRLVTVDAAKGYEQSRVIFTYGRERVGWTAGFAYAESGFLLVERLAAAPDPLADDDAYYFTGQPVLLAAA